MKLKLCLKHIPKENNKNTRQNEGKQEKTSRNKLLLLKEHKNKP